MGYVYYNPNPEKKIVGDCVVRALTVMFDDTWENIYADLTMLGRFMYDMPNSNSVWGEYLKLNGFKQYVLPDTCPSCYTVRDFVQDYPVGKYMLATGTHVIAVVDGDYYDTGDSGSEVPIYYWKKEITNGY